MGLECVLEGNLGFHVCMCVCGGGGRQEWMHTVEGLCVGVSCRSLVGSYWSTQLAHFVVSFLFSNASVLCEWEWDWCGSQYSHAWGGQHLCTYVMNEWLPVHGSSACCFGVHTVQWCGEVWRVVELTRGRSPLLMCVWSQVWLDVFHLGKWSGGVSLPLLVTVVFIDISCRETGELLSLPDSMCYVRSIQCRYMVGQSATVHQLASRGGMTERWWCLCKHLTNGLAASGHNLSVD